MKKIFFVLFFFSSVFAIGQIRQTSPGTKTGDTTDIKGILYFNNLTNSDSTTSKPVSIGSDGRVYKLTNWPTGAGGSGVTTLAAIGSTPNANGATISGSTLNLQPADGSFGGVVTTGTQTIAGAKTFSSAFTSSTSTTSPILIGGTGTGSSISIRPTSGVGSTSADIIFQNGNNGGTEIARVTGSNGYTGFGTASPVMKFDITNGTQVTGSNSNNPNALNVTGSNQGITSGGATMFLNSNSAMGADVGASIAFTALRVSGDNASDLIYAVAKGAKENASSRNYNGYFAIATQNHSAGALIERFRITSGGGIVVNSTVTSGGTTGNQTIDKPSGTVNFAAAATTLTVTNSLVTTSSIVFAVVRTNDATATIKNVVPGSGSFVITLNAAATAETSVGFFVIN